MGGGSPGCSPDGKAPLLSRAGVCIEETETISLLISSSTDRNLICSYCDTRLKVKAADQSHVKQIFQFQSVPCEDLPLSQICVNGNQSDFKQLLLSVDCRLLSQTRHVILWICCLGLFSRLSLVCQTKRLMQKIIIGLINRENNHWLAKLDLILCVL